jgi:hypothetical protein
MKAEVVSLAFWKCDSLIRLYTAWLRRDRKWKGEPKICRRISQRYMNGPTASQN